MYLCQRVLFSEYYLQPAYLGLPKRTLELKEVCPLTVTNCASQPELINEMKLLIMEVGSSP